MGPTKRAFTQHEALNEAGLIPKAVAVKKLGRI